jgi:hypothetical protein
MMIEWQPIETAPKDGTDIMLFEPSYGCVIAYWGIAPAGTDDTEQWLESYIDERLFKSQPPTHWMPLPKSPSE